MFNQDELKMIFHVFGNTIGGSKIANDIFDKIRIDLYGETELHPISPNLKISQGFKERDIKQSTGGWIVLSDSDIEEL